MYTSIMEIKKINSIGIVLVFALVIFTFMLIMTNSTPYKKAEEIPFEYQYQIKNEKPYSLDDDPNIVHWEIIDGELSIYTKADSIRDERARWRYKDSLYKAETEGLFDN